jgi:plasmid stabilization system protein ParE
LIFYRARNGGRIEIIRVLHTAMDMAARLRDR